MSNTFLSRNLVTNDQILQYKINKSCFFTDTFFVRKESNSNQVFICIQVFVSDKGCVKVYAMKSSIGFMEDLK